MSCLSHAFSFNQTPYQFLSFIQLFSWALLQPVASYPKQDMGWSVLARNGRHLQKENSVTGA